jgi:hypothetical protein
MDRDQASANPVRFRANVGFQVPGEVPTRSRFPAPSERTGGLIARSRLGRGDREKPGELTRPVLVD